MKFPRPITRYLPIATLLVGTFVAVDTSAARGDGGTPVFSGTDAGYQVTVFATPSPLRAGPVELGVWVDDAHTRQLVTAARVDVKIVPSGRPELGRTVKIDAEHAGNRLLRSATFELPRGGLWKFELVVTEPGRSAEFAWEAPVAGPTPRWLALWPWYSWPALVIAIFATHEILVARRRSRSVPTERPEKNLRAEAS